MLSALRATGLVARELVSAGTLAELAERALAQMRVALDLDLAVLFLPHSGGEPTLERYVSCGESDTATRARDELCFDEEAWRLAITSGGPLVFQESASWLVENPFEPPAEWWLVLPLFYGESMAGVAIFRCPIAAQY